VATHVSHLPPVSTMFAALLGYNPIQNLLAPSGVLHRLPAHNVAVLTGRQFFPHLISAPFHHGLVIVFTAAAIMSLTGALVSLLRGKRYYYEEPAPAPAPARPAAARPTGSGSTPAVPDELGFSAPAGDPRTPARRDTGPAPGA
jgi:hypothetical protein